MRLMIDYWPRLADPGEGSENLVTNTLWKRC